MPACQVAELTLPTHQERSRLPRPASAIRRLLKALTTEWLSVVREELATANPYEKIPSECLAVSKLAHAATGLVAICA